MLELATVHGAQGSEWALIEDSSPSICMLGVDTEVWVDRSMEIRSDATEP